MTSVFLKILNMSITASWLILAAVLIRFLMKKAPKWISCLLWALVAFRLVCPFSFESVFSLVPNGEPVPADIELSREPSVHFGIEFINNPVNEVIADSFTPEEADSANPLQIVVFVLTLVWFAGMILMIVYAFASYFGLKKRVSASVELQKGVRACDDIRSPFILGMLRPVIYVPSSIGKESLDSVLKHEQAHLARRDHWWKPLGFALLSVYWFNPLCWLAYVLLCRDIEAACDEKVIRSMDKDSVAAYSQALLDLNYSRRTIAACPVAFGEVGVKDRIKGVLNYKKPAFWVIVVALVGCIVVAVCFLTDPKRTQKDSDLNPGSFVRYFDDETSLLYQSSLVLNDDGTFTFSPSMISSYRGFGTWEIKGDRLILSDTGMGDVRKEVFRIEDGRLYYIAKESATDSVWHVENNAEYVRGEISFSYPDDDTVTADPEIITDEEDDNTDIYADIFSEPGRMNYDQTLFNFAVDLFHSDDYVPPKHGSGTPSTWCALGGVGKCIDPGFANRATYVDGKLTDYEWMDNHSWKEKITTFTVGGYSCCLYKYGFDLFTAPELNDPFAESPQTEYWVIFFTRGEGKPLYLKYYNCDHYSMEQAMEDIVPGAAIFSQMSKWDAIWRETRDWPLKRDDKDWDSISYLIMPCCPIEKVLPDNRGQGSGIYRRLNDAKKMVYGGYAFRNGSEK